MPQGTIKSKKSKSVLRLKAKPCMVTHREHLTPRRPFCAHPNLVRLNPYARQSLNAFRLNPILPQVRMIALQASHVLPDVREKLFQVEDGISTN